MIIYYAGTGEGANYYIPEDKLKKNKVNILMTFYYTFVNGRNEKRFMLHYKTRKRKLNKEKK